MELATYELLRRAALIADDSETAAAGMPSQLARRVRLAPGEKQHSPASWRHPLKRFAFDGGG
jgi:hypothetical protein